MHEGSTYVINREKNFSIIFEFWIIICLLFVYTLDNLPSEILMMCPYLTIEFVVSGV